MDDLELKNIRKLSDDFTLVSGVGGRYLDDKVYDSELLNVSTDNPEQLYSMFHAYFQGEYALIPKTLDLTLGTKLEHVDYTGLEVEPTARLGYTIDDSNFAWSSQSKLENTI
jgi:iron complex outermembrane receptor protein